MAPQDAAATLSIERFFGFSLLGLVASGYLAVAGSGYLDAPTIALTAAGLLLRALVLAGFVPLQISDRAITVACLAYSAFFVADYFAFSRSLILNARSPRNWAFHSARQNSQGTAALPNSRLPLYQPRYIAQSQVKGAPYSQRNNGFTPVVAQWPNQSDNSWIGAKFG